MDDETISIAAAIDTKTKATVIVIEEYELGGCSCAISVNGIAPTRADGCGSNLIEVMERYVIPALEKKHKQPAITRSYAVPRVEHYVAPANPPPRAAVEKGEVLDDVPGFLRTHPGHASGLVEKVRAMGGNGVKASAFLFCAGIAFAAFVQRLGVA